MGEARDQPVNDGGKFIIGVAGNKKIPARIPGSGLIVAGFCGVWKDVRTDTWAALLFRSGELLVAHSTRLSFCAERSAFNAAAVVAATLGVTLSGRFVCDPVKGLLRRIIPSEEILRPFIQLHRFFMSSCC